MHRSIILFTIAVLATSALGDKLVCQELLIDAQAYYDVNSLTHNSSMLPYTNSLTNKSGTVIYNFCAQPDISNCTTITIDGVYFNDTKNVNTTSSYSAVLNENGVCRTLTTSKNPNFRAINIDDALAGVILDYDKDQMNKLGFSVELTCNSSEEYQVTEVTENRGTITVHAQSASGCPSWGYYQVQQFLNRYKFIFVAVGVLTGLFICFLGLKLFVPSLFIVTFLAVFLAFFVLLLNVALSSTSSNGARWGCVAAAGILGIIAGILMVVLRRFGVFVLGAWLGVISLNLGYSLIVAHLGAGLWIYICLAVAAGLLGGVIAYFVHEHAIIVSTAVGGAYIALKAFSLVLPQDKQFPNEYNIAKQISNGVKDIPTAFYVYFALVIVLAAVGIFVQYKYKKTDEEKDDLGFDRLGYPTNGYSAMNNA